MLKVKSLLNIAFTGIILLTGCSKQPENKTILNLNKCILPSGTKAPNWVCTQELSNKEYSNANNYIFSVGIGLSQPDPDMQIQEALASARDKLSQRIQVKIKNMFKKFQSTTGLKNNGTLDRTTEFVSKQLSKATLDDNKIITMWTDKKTKNIYILLGLPKTEIKQNIYNSTKTSLNNNKALWQKFIASKAYKELEEQFKNYKNK